LIKLIISHDRILTQRLDRIKNKKGKMENLKVEPFFTFNFQFFVSFATLCY
jgi:hypothetical protein